MNPYYDRGYEAGLECDDRCPYLPFTFPAFWWHIGFFVGHQTLCAQMEALYFMHGA
jgi:hypothetical protein